MQHSVVRVKNSAEAALDLIRKDYPEYHPLIALARMAHAENVTCDPRLELEVHKAILPYVAPKLQTAEVKLDVLDRRVVVTLFDETAELEDGTEVEVEVPVLIEDARELVRLD